MNAESARRQRVLVVEDENDLGVSLTHALCLNGYEARVADRGESALRALRTFAPDLVLLDLVLPDMSGLDICQHINKSTDPRKPTIIILSGKASETDRVVGFKLGADDYVVKPFSLSELMLRIEARLRARRAVEQNGRSKSPAVSEVVERKHVLGKLTVDEASYRVFVGQKEIQVSPMEMRLLIDLFRAPGKIRTKRHLLTKIWGYEQGAHSRTVDTHIKRLRDKLGKASNLLQTIRGVGFRLADPEMANSHSWGATLR